MCWSPHWEGTRAYSLTSPATPLTSARAPVSPQCPEGSRNASLLQIRRGTEESTGENQQPADIPEPPPKSQARDRAHGHQGVGSPKARLNAMSDKARAEFLPAEQRMCVACSPSSQSCFQKEAASTTAYYIKVHSFIFCNALNCNKQNFTRYYWFYTPFL